MSFLSSLEANIPALRRYAWALLRNASDADDLVQDCLVRALDQMDFKMPQGDLRRWLFTIMHNLHVSRRRRRTVRAEVTVDQSDAVPPSRATQAETRDALRGLASLPEEQRQVLLLVTVEGFGYVDVAGILGIPVGTVMSRLSCARDKLRDFVEGKERPMLRTVK
jgi:RNA polymerase sigma-70 factor (ECF subfamily)